MNDTGNNNKQILNMATYPDSLFCLGSDGVLFWALQAFLFLAAIVAFIANKAAEYRAGKGGATLSVTRGHESMSLFYGSYVALNGLFVALCLSVEVIEGYRIFWVLLDTLAPAYICILNPWSRNKLLGWAHRLREIEKR